VERTVVAYPCRYSAGNRRPDHDTIAAVRRTVLPVLKALFVQVLLLAQEEGVLTRSTISLDGADASKSKAVSYKCLRELEGHLYAEVEELCALAERLDERERPDGWWCATKSRDERTIWRAWWRPKRSLRRVRVRGSGRTPSRRCMRRRWRVKATAAGARAHAPNARFPCQGSVQLYRPKKGARSDNSA